MIGRDDIIAAAVKCWGNPTEKRGDKWRFGGKQGQSLDLKKGVWVDFTDVGANGKPLGGGAKDLLIKAGMWVERRPAPAANGHAIEGQFARVHSYHDERGALLFQTVKRHDGRWTQRRPNGRDWVWDVAGVRRVLYRLPELVASDPRATVYVVEGEKDADNLARLGVVATTNPGGAGKWRTDDNEFLRGRTVVILPDNDKVGRDHADRVMKMLAATAASVAIVELPNLADKEDVSDWIAGGGNIDLLTGLTAEAAGPRREDFYAYMPGANFLFVPSRDLWPTRSVNARLGKVDGVTAAAWLAVNRPIEQMSWIPGRELVVKNRLIDQGGFITRNGVALFNLYRPPTVRSGDPHAAALWVNHIRRIYPDDADHILDWLAQRRQHPDVKLNHALVLGGAAGIGKDTLLEPVRHAVGPWNFVEVSPAQVMGRFNGFLKSVILRVSEARDLGEIDRFTFYDHMKTIIAAPPEALRVDEKNLREHYVLNLTGVVFTTNYKTDGMYLHPDDRRHYVAWSNLTKADFDEAYWQTLWTFYRTGGASHVAAFLAARDLSRFNPKAAPRLTQAFHDIATAYRAPEDAELRDLIDSIGNPAVLTLPTLRAHATGDLVVFLSDRKSRRVIPHRLESCGYVPVRNQDATDGFWKVNGQRQIIYARKELTIHDQIAEAKKITRSLFR